MWCEVVGAAVCGCSWAASCATVDARLQLNVVAVVALSGWSSGLACLSIGSLPAFTLLFCFTVLLVVSACRSLRLTLGRVVRNSEGRRNYSTLPASVCQLVCSLYHDTYFTSVGGDGGSSILIRRAAFTLCLPHACCMPLAAIGRGAPHVVIAAGSAESKFHHDVITGLLPRVGASRGASRFLSDREMFVRVGCAWVGVLKLIHWLVFACICR